MKRNIIYTCTLFALLLLVSCTKEIEQETPKYLDLQGLTLDEVQNLTEEDLADIGIPEMESLLSTSIISQDELISREDEHGSLVEYVNGFTSQTFEDLELQRIIIFWAKKYEDGYVEGFWRRLRYNNGQYDPLTSGTGDVTCFTIIENTAWMGGLTTSGDIGGSAWRFQDAGNFVYSATEDLMSIETINPDPILADVYCFYTVDDPIMQPIDYGFVNIITQ